MKGLVAALALCALACTACTVNRKSEQFACLTNADCMDGRTCNQGYCVTDGSGGPGSGTDPACASQCSSCDHSTTPPTCVIQGAGEATITCPKDAPCRVVCDAPASCGTVNCPSNAASCDIECSSFDACGQVTCDAPTCTINCSSAGACGDVMCGDNGGACNITCSTANACSEVACGNACSCAVSCANKPACGALSCPKSDQGGFCSDTGSAGGVCSSSPSGCNQC